MFSEQIVNLIYDVAKKENEYLQKGKNGIMDCPELAFVYLVARRLSGIFPQHDIDWSLEKTNNKWNMRRLDLYINPNLPPPNEGIIAIEFKMGYEVVEWEEDVDKLLNIKNIKTLHRIFCALLLKDPPESDRIKQLEEGVKGNSINRITEFNSFSTLYKGRPNQCIIGAWEVK
jgi:hypothetical protein